MRRSLVLILSLALGPLAAFAQTESKSPSQTDNTLSAQTESKSPGKADSKSVEPAGSPESAQALIEKAESLYSKGDQAFANGDKETARKLFDQALDTIITSGRSTSANSRLEAYYRDLVTRIHGHEALEGDDHSEKTAPAPLDELASLTEKDLATVTTNGVKIYGKYDFDFTVAEPVLQYLSYFVAGRGRSTMEVGLQRSGRYREMAERIFKEEKVPVDLIWLAQAESVWKPNALSRSAAKGIWQFVSSTGTRYGLSQTVWVDERSQPEKSTKAAARYLHWLHDHFAGDWLLAMAAYNAGEGRVDDAVGRCGYADFWELYQRGMLPQETRNYVPIILSIIITSKNQKRYGFDVKPDQAVLYDSVEVPSQTDLKVVADLCGLPYDSIGDLNPELRRGVSPAGTPYTIRIPKGLKKAFEQAYAKLPEDQRVRRVVIAREESEGYRSAYRTQLVAYHARSGDTLSALSRRYGVPVTDLARANRISTHGTIHKGQTIKIPMKVKDRRHGYGRYREEKASRSRLSRSRRSSRGHSRTRHRSRR
jgi:membrane-bound lytic murein transglycosylase D